jgi:UDP-glucose 4-epimerase
MKYLVTGGAGFIGSHIVDRLILDGNEVVVIDNESADSNEKFFWNNKAKNYKLDITDYDSIRKLFNNVHTVFHLAAESRIQPAIKNPIKAAKVNFLGTMTILQCAREAGCDRVIYSSTSSAYGRKNTPPLKEDMPNDCLNPYSVTKSGGETLCKMYTDLFGLNTITFRYFNVYGDRQPLRGEYAPVIGLFLRQKKNSLPMTIVGDGEQRRDFTLIDDVVEANIAASKTSDKLAFGELFNIGSGINYSILDLVEMIGGEYKHIEPRIGEARISLADISKAKKILGWEPRGSLREWIKNETRQD